LVLASMSIGSGHPPIVLLANPNKFLYRRTRPLDVMRIVWAVWCEMDRSAETSPDREQRRNGKGKSHTLHGLEHESKCDPLESYLCFLRRWALA
jgi:hypothetical protein